MIGDNQQEDRIPLMNEMGSKPSGKRSLHSIAARASSGIQAAGKGIPQLIPDGLTPGEHVVVAMMTCHPLQLAPTLFPPVAYATKYGGDTYECVTQRHQMLCLVRQLRNELQSECATAIKMCNPIVAKILTQNGFTRNIPLQRELGFILISLIGCRTIIDVRHTDGWTCGMGSRNAIPDKARPVFNRGCCRQIQTEQYKNDRSSHPHW